MSGPKVVRIVSREERVALCEGLLAGLDAMREEWIRVGRRNGVLTDEEIDAVRSRHASIREMLKADRFAEVQREVPADIACIQADMERRLAAAAAAEAAARSADRRRAQAASSVLAALENAGSEIPDDLRQALRGAAAGGHDGGAAIAKGFALLAKLATPSLTQQQRELAAALRDDDGVRSVDAWIGTQARSPVERMLGKVDGYIATLRVLTDDTTCGPFEARAARLAESAADSTLAAKVDSLVVELAKAVDLAKSLEAVRVRLRFLAAELRQMGTPQALSESDSVNAIIGSPLAALREYEGRAAAISERLRHEATAKARRRAVLEGLAGLGYEVAEQMETAWVANGRVVLRQASRPGYGVEIGGGGDAARVQLRTVAFREASDALDITRDRDAETLWCGEFAELRKGFATGGGEILIEQALGVGVAPLRAVGGSTDSDQRKTRATSDPARAQNSRFL